MGGEFCVQVDEARQPFLLLADHGRRGTLDETGRGQLFFRLGDFAFDAREFLTHPLFLGGDVDLDLQHQTETADDLHRRFRCRQVFTGGSDFR